MEARNTPPPEDQLKQLSEEVEWKWAGVVTCMRQATLELIPDLTDEEKIMLLESFWSTHISIMERQERLTPGITEAVLTRAEALAKEVGSK